MKFGAKNFVKGPALLLIERIQGIKILRLDELLTFFAIKHGKVGRLINLTR